MDGLDADGQGFLQVPQDVAAGAVGRRVVQQQLERLQLDQHDHVLQEVALDVGRQVWNIQELMMKEEEEEEEGNVVASLEHQEITDLNLKVHFKDTCLLLTYHLVF